MPVPDTAKNEMLAERFSSFELIQSELGQVRQRIQELLCTSDEQIQQCLEYVTDPPGKMIRPALVLLCGKCIGKIQPEHIDLAAMVELVHRASLLHDDVIDAAETRRGKPTANALWGNSTAVLLGDFLLSRAFYLGKSIQVKDAADVLCHTSHNLCCGELRQNLWRGYWDISLRQYYEIIEAKTAILFQTSCRLGAMASKASHEQIEACSRFGLQFGMAFQIADDLLDIMGTQKEIGKTLGSDLAQRKLTLPIIYWIGQGEQKKTERITQLKQDCNIEGLIQQLTESGSIDYAITQIRECIAQAKHSIDGISHTPPKESLVTMANAILDRLA